MRKWIGRRQHGDGVSASAHPVEGSDQERVGWMAQVVADDLKAQGALRWLRHDGT